MGIYRSLSEKGTIFVNWFQVESTIIAQQKKGRQGRLLHDNNHRNNFKFSCNWQQEQQNTNLFIFIVKFCSGLIK